MAVATKSKVLTIDDVNKTLEDSLKGVFESERFTELLDVMSRNKNYSINNTILIGAQRPDSTMVLGFKEWKKLGRYVNKGEKGIMILAPLVGKKDMDKIDPLTKKPLLDSNGITVKENKSVIHGFRAVTVFDVLQTDGKELPSVRDFIAREMANDEYMSKLYVDYKTYLNETLGLDVKEAETDKGVGGYYNRRTEEIVISTGENKNDTEKFRVLIHEYGHALLHHQNSEMKDLPRGHKEAQAESVAYVVSNYYGLDSSAVSTGYIATWSQDIKMAKQALTEIQSVANKIIDDVDRLQKDKIQNFYRDNTKEYEQAKKYLIGEVGISEKAFEIDQKKETHIELINKENGYILSGKLEYSNRSDLFYLRTNRNLIEPLSELAQDGNLKVLNVEQELGQVKDITQYSRIEEHYSIKKLENGPYVIQTSNGQDIISKKFETVDLATDFKLRTSISQDLHRNTFIKKMFNTTSLQTEFQTVLNKGQEDINKSVGQYLSHHSNKNLHLSGTSGITIGWALLKNPSLKTAEQLQVFSEQNKNVPTYTKLPEELKNLKEVAHEKKGEIVIKEVTTVVELEHIPER